MRIHQPVLGVPGVMPRHPAAVAEQIAEGADIVEIDIPVAIDIGTEPFAVRVRRFVRQSAVESHVERGDVVEIDVPVTVRVAGDELIGQVPILIVDETLLDILGPYGRPGNPH